MICNKCGAKNRDTRTKCFNCGNSFVAETPKDPAYDDYPDDIDQLTPTPDTPEKTDTVSAHTAESFTIENIYENDVQDNYDDEYDIAPEDPASVDPDVDDAPADESSVEYDEYDEYDNEIYNDDDVNDSPEAEIAQLEVDENTEQYFKTAKKKRSTAFAVVIWILALLFIIVAIVVGVLIYTMLTEDDNVNVDPTISTIAELNIDPPVITKNKDSNGIEYIHAVFKGTPGDRIHLKCNNNYYTFIEETLQLDLYLEDLFSSEYEFRDSTVDANMYAYYVRDKKEYSCVSPSFKMSVPEAELDISSLTGQEMKVYRDTFTLKFWTETDAIVQLNNKNITSSMDGMGNFAYDISVEPNSTNTYYLSVAQPYHTPKSEVFILSRDALPVTLTIAANSTEPQSDSVLVLKCQTEEDTDITVEGLPVLELNKNELYNTCELKLDLSECDYGEIEVLISATNSKGTSTKSHIVKYWPDETKITTTASKFNSAVATNSANYKGINYVINSAKATKNISTNKFEAVCTLNDLEYTIIIKNEFVSTNIIKDSSYKIFAQCTGETENGIPVFRAWYIYKA